jgi:hypothetical protein
MSSNIVTNKDYGALSRISVFDETLAWERPDLITINHSYLKSEDLYCFQIRYKNSRLGEHRRIFCEMQSIRNITVKKRLFDNSDIDCSFTSFQSFVEFILNSFPKVSNIREKLWYDM